MGKEFAAECTEETDDVGELSGNRDIRAGATNDSPKGREYNGILFLGWRVGQAKYGLGMIYEEYPDAATG